MNRADGDLLPFNITSFNLAYYFAGVEPAFLQEEVGPANNSNRTKQNEVDNSVTGII